MSNKWEVIIIRAPKGSGVSDAISKLAKEENRSVSNYVVTLLIQHIKEKKK